MASIVCEHDETVIMASDEAIWVSRGFEYLDDFVLTNRALYCAFEKRDSLFKKPNREVCRLSLSDIRRANGRALVSQARREGSNCLKIQFVQGTEYFSFARAAKKMVPQWVDGVNRALGTTAPPLSARNNQEPDSLSGAFAKVAENVRNVVDTAAESINSPIAQLGVNLGGLSDQGRSARQPGGQDIYEIACEEGPNFCAKCGAKLVPNAIFCSACGNKLDSDGGESVTRRGHEGSREKASFSTGVRSNEADDYSEQASNRAESTKREDYAGTIFKCPSCGESIPSFVDKCPTCGHEFRNVDVARSVRELSERLSAIERKRSKNPPQKGERDAGGISSIDEQKINLIRNFPIPNTKEDLSEFMILALSNYDVDYTDAGDEDGSDSERALSDAWKAKLEQAFNKAEVLFGDDPALERFKTMRRKKLDEIEAKRVEAMRKNVRVWIFSVLAIVLALGLIGVIFACDGLSIQRENDRLQGIVEEVYVLVDEGKYSLARMKASEIVFSGSTTSGGEQAAEKWDTVRRETIAMIDEVEGKK